MNQAQRCKHRADYVCEICGYTPPLPDLRNRLIRAHHIRYRSHNGTSFQHNLIALCAKCHAVAHYLQIEERFHLIRAAREARGMYFLPASQNYHSWGIATVHIARPSIALWEKAYLEDMRIASEAVSRRIRHNSTKEKS